MKEKKKKNYDTNDDNKTTRHIKKGATFVPKSYKNVENL